MASIVGNLYSDVPVRRVPLTGAALAESMQTIRRGAVSENFGRVRRNNKMFKLEPLTQDV